MLLFFEYADLYYLIRNISTIYRRKLVPQPQDALKAEDWMHYLQDTALARFEDDPTRRFDIYETPEIGTHSYLSDPPPVCLKGVPNASAAAYGLRDWSELRGLEDYLLINGDLMVVSVSIVSRTGLVTC